MKTEAKMARCSLAASMAVFACLSVAGAAETQDLVSLRIEGQGIEQLILQDEKGRTRTFESPGPTVTLPPGNYTIHTVRLQGDHYAPSHLIPTELRVIADPNAPATLRIGAPLRHVVNVERQGPTMVLHYELIGQGGESYVISRNQPEQRPVFTVYRGDRQVASGNFEFG